MVINVDNDLTPRLKPWAVSSEREMNVTCKWPSSWAFDNPNAFVVNKSIPLFGGITGNINKGKAEK